MVHILETQSSDDTTSVLKERIHESENEASRVAITLLSALGLKQLERFVDEQTKDTLLAGVRVTQEGKLDFSVAEERFSKLPAQWLKLVERFLYKLAAALKARGVESGIVKAKIEAPIITVAPEVRSMLAGMGMEKLITEGSVKNIESDLVAKDGTMQPVTVSASALRNEMGAGEGMVIAAGDMREVKKLQEEKVAILEKAKKDLEQKVSERTQSLENAQRATLNILEDIEEEKDNVSRERDKIDSILHSIGDGVFVIDTRYRITMFNKVAANLSGFTIGEGLGKSYDKVFNFIHEKSGKINNLFIKKAMATGEIQEMANHTVLVKKDGTKVAVSDSAAPFKDNSKKVIGCVVVFRDVTKERDIDRAKTEFVSLASHQLKTPLSSISWYTEMLLGGDVGALTKDQKKYLDEVYRGNQRMIGLVNALLNVSRIELGTLAIEPVPTRLKAVVESVLKELEQNIKSKKIKIKKNYGESLSTINVDLNLIRIIFQNLISNAVKYTPERGTIILGLKEELPNIVISVADTGYGIPKNQQSKIFTKLFRADNIREKETDGTGLGLYIVKAIMEQSGGKIWFESEEGKGTTFYIALPLTGMKKSRGTKGLEKT